MKHLHILSIAIALSGCRSHKSIVTSETDSTALSVIRTETIRSAYTNDSVASESFITFLPEGGEISVGPSGDISLKAVAKARLSGIAARSSAAVTTLTADSLSSVNAISTEKKEKPEATPQAKNRGILFPLIGFCIVFIIITTLIKTWLKSNR